MKLILFYTKETKIFQWNIIEEKMDIMMHHLLSNSIENVTKNMNNYTFYTYSCNFIFVYCLPVAFRITKWLDELCLVLIFLQIFPLFILVRFR